jgi:hypothetical protein|tara:strand:- start:436 stop:567 length:132 start_codon:yes stop_codon:yes gene_type:complete
MTIEELKEIIAQNADAAELGHIGAQMVVINAELELSRIGQKDS